VGRVRALAVLSVVRGLKLRALGLNRVTAAHIGRLTRPGGFVALIERSHQPVLPTKEVSMYDFVPVP